MATKRLGRAVEAPDLVAALRIYGLHPIDIARVVNVDVETMAAWKVRGAKPQASTHAKLEDLREIILLLSDSLSPRGVGQWLYARNRILDGQRPLDALRDGHKKGTLGAARAFVDGAYV